MVSLDGYENFTVIHQSNETLVYSAIRSNDKIPVTIKRTRQEHPTPNKLEKYKHEYELLIKLDSPHIIKPYTLIEEHNSSTIVLESFSSPALLQSLRIRRLTVIESLIIVRNITRALTYLHNKNIVHKHITPENILYQNETGDIKLIDFELASYVNIKKTINADVSITGAINYISPEQTGRTNRSIDYRTDFYSLGALFYELLVGTPPFSGSANDSAQTIYHHIVKQPTSPTEKDNTIPVALSQITLKLLEKAPEDRYQSAYSIERDLNICIEALKNGGDASSLQKFSVALDDIPEQLNISEQLIEREDELRILNGAYQKVQSGSSANVICIGDAGIGKSSLIDEFKRNLLTDKTYFLQGKQNVINSTVPYNAISIVLRDLCRQLLRTDDLPKLRNGVETALQDTSAIMLKLVPSLANIISTDKPERHESSANNPLDSKNKVVQGVANLLEYASQNNTVIVLHIDNIQWIDHASIELLKTLIFQRKLKYLLVLANYRSNELEKSHPTRKLLSNILKAAPSLTTIILKNLNTKSVAKLLSETFYCSEEECQPLANIVHQKTNGNPLAIKEFITTLTLKNILHFENAYREWQWNLDLVKNSPPTSNVSSILAEELKNLEPETQEVLEIAACFGDTFNLATIKQISKLDYTETTNRLASAAREGYLTQRPANGANIDDVSYAFSHEGIQQTAYALLSVETRNSIHTNVGLALLETHKDVLETHIFNIVNQLNNGFDGLIIAANSDASFSKNKHDINRLLELNLLAAKKAKSSAAFQAEFKYLKTAIALQGKDIWGNYDRSIFIYTEAAEAAYLCGDKVQLNNIVTILLENANNRLDKAKAYEILIRALVAFNQPKLAISEALKALSVLQVKLPKHINQLSVGIEMIYQTLIMNSPLRTHEKQMLDPTSKATMRILNIMVQAAYLQGDKRIVLYILKMIELSLKYGIAPESVVAYPMMGAILITYFGTIESAHRFGVVALEHLNESNREFHCKTITITTNFINVWKQPLKETLKPLSRAYEIGMETGDVEFALIAAITSSANAFIMGHNLNSIITRLSGHTQQAKDLNQVPTATMGAIYQQAISNLTTYNDQPWIFNGDFYQEPSAGEEPSAGKKPSAGDETSIANLYILKLYIAVIFNQNRTALHYANEARSRLDTVASSPAVSFFVLYESLACIRCLKDAPLLQRLKLHYRIKANLRGLRKWSNHAPYNTLHALKLVEAQYASANDQLLKAITNFELAIQYAREFGFLKELAYSHELAGLFYTSQQNYELAHFHLKKAKDSYVEWGAINKVKAMEKRHPALSDNQYPADIQVVVGNNVHNQMLHNELLDFSAVLKATQALSGEIILATLLEKLMDVALENSGAHGAGLILRHDNKLYSEIRSQFTGTETEHFVNKVALLSSQDLPISIIQFVARTKEDVVLNNALIEDIFTQDAYLLKNEPKSILCVPILSRSHLTGILYLENLKNTQTFTRERVALLKLLASQAAIAIENAKLYRQLNDSRNKYLSLYENAVEGIFEIATDGTVLSLNPAGQQLIGYVDAKNKLHEVTVKPKLFFVDPKAQSKFISLLAEGNPVVGFETKIRKMDKEELWVVISAKLVAETDNKPAHVEGSIIDITERKLREVAEQEKLLAIEATKTKSQFLANMSHEIRTPMNAIIGYTKLALTTELSTKQTEYLSTIQNSSNHLLRVVNDILDISKVESGNLELQKKPFSIKTILTDINKLFRYDAEEKGLDLMLPDPETLTTKNGHDILYLGDSARISQILINLVSNALKFTQKGNINIDFERLILGDHNVCLNFSVKDTGIGIEENRIEEIFESFTQAEVTPRVDGTGLGLSISKRLVEMMQGSIHAISERGIGSHFYFSVIVESCDSNIEAGNTEKQIETSSSPQETALGERLLLVEDNEINRKLAIEVLQKAGYHVTAVVNGKEALIILSKEVFFAVLMDLRMPVMDGNEAAQKIRTQASLKRLPLIAISAGVLPHEIDEALQSGFDHYITKPIDFDALLTLLNDIAGIKDIPRVNLRSETYRSKYNIRGVDFDRALKGHDYDEKLFGHLASEFVRIYRHADTEFIKLIDASNHDVKSIEHEKAVRLVHNVAGVAGNFGGLSLMDAARALEHEVVDGTEPSYINLTALTRELENFILAIEQYLENTNTESDITDI